MLVLVHYQHRNLNIPVQLAAVASYCSSLAGMQDIIRLLPDALANQIAAGEVVQRPASVVKELMENSIDAGADSIELIIGDYGKGLIQVVDNGGGMNETDARMSLERHATSKLNTAEDLFAIRTMGFRGEALASIAAVAQMELKTRMEASELGTLIQVEASEVSNQEPWAMEPGTSISVKNLFYNVPARRNFLKSNGVEMKHMVDEFIRIAMAHPGKNFRMYQEGTETYNLPSGKLSQRIVGLMGKNYKDQLVSCKTDTDLLSITGYVGKPEFSKKTRGEQYLFVNQRFVRNNYLNHAVKMAYEGLIQEQHYPFYVLFLEIDPKHIDVNVHPTKTEIKFDDERTVYAMVRASVKQALGAHNIYPSLDFDSDINLMGNLTSELSRADRSFEQLNNPGVRKESTKNWESLFDENLMRKGDAVNQAVDRELGREESITFTSKASSMEDSQKTTGNFLQLQNSYIISPVKSGMMLIDQKAALERLIYEKLKDRAESKLNLSQQCLFPPTVDFSESDFKLVMDLKDELTQLGFDFEVFGTHSIVIHGIPVDIVNENEKGLFEGLIEQYKNSKDDLEISEREKIIQGLAKRASANNLRRLTVIEMEELVNQLFACENPNYAPDGRPTFKIVELKTIENFFK